MDEYINRETLKQSLLTRGFYPVFVKTALEEAPAIDIVRCKDCVNYCGFERCKNGICDKDVCNKRTVYPNDFCSYGERREQ